MEPRRETTELNDLPRVPRSEWEGHANYPDHVLLLGSHANFRRLSKHLVDSAWKCWAVDPKTEPNPEVRNLFVRWKNAMKNHERYEEGKLYPYLERRYGTSMTALSCQHEALQELEERVLGAFRAGDPLAFASALKDHDSLLLSHLEEEEEVVIPMLLSLSRDEFVRFVDGG